MDPQVRDRDRKVEGDEIEVTPAALRATTRVVMLAMFVCVVFPQTYGE